MTAQAPARPPGASTTVRPPGWVANLRLGTALLLAAGRAGRMRWILVAVGLALCTLVLLLAGSIGPALDSRDGRTAALSPRSAPVGAAVEAAAIQPSWFEANETMSIYRGDRVRVTELAAVDPAVVAAPPGVDRFPGPGEVVVSPALADLLAGPDGDGFRPRLGGDTVVGTIGADGLLAPDELRLYRGVVADPAGWAPYLVADGWGGGTVASSAVMYGVPGTSLIAVLLTAGVTIVIVPLLLFVGLMSRVGSVDRDRRDAGLRLLGATAGQLRVITVVETATAALAGLGLGTAAFLLARQAAPFVAVGQAGFFPADLRPPSDALVAIVLAVPLLAVGSVLAARRPDPIGVVRQQSPPRPPRRLWWRLLFPAAGGLLLLALSRAEFGGQLPAIGVGIVALLVTAAVLLPWVLERLVRLLPDGPPAWQLAVGGLRLDPGTPARVVAGLSVVLAGAIALQPLLAAGDWLDREGEVAYQVQLADVPTSEMARVVDLLQDRLGPAADIRGGALVTGTVTSPGRPNALPPGTLIDLRLAPCGALGVACTDGMVFAVSDSGEPMDGGPSPAGSVVAISVPVNSGASRSTTFDWTVPEPTATVSLPAYYPSTLAVTPGAFGPDIEPVLRSSPARFSVTGVEASAGMADTLRADLADLGSRVEVRAAGEPADLGLRSVLSPTARTGLMIGAMLTLVVAVVGLIVTTVEQWQHRRRPLTLAVAAGLPRSVLARSMLIGATLPIAVAVALSVLSAWLLVTLLGPLLGVPIALDWTVVTLYSAGAVGLVILLAAASTLALPALIRPTELRTG